ncbi:hypothetical protein OZX57_06480 [Bifidobacterium sp. ESL0682]|uniref:hypothetical protein n=1 Tax=Bifidobacterium sp. ESL0682 TaxID=2983212 RepID=UPI0023F9331A|nr:hypothetical protein [Bifidobacterium sp. ESL0682]WEV41632.1 hypothetical protein OZX57_06480 [Bifidobacterium sp. ESL0682]
MAEQAAGNTETGSENLEGQQTSNPATGAEDATGTESQNAEVTDWKAEAEKWKAMSRKNEAQAKSNADKAKQFDEFQESQKTELQKAQDEAAKYKAEFEAQQVKSLQAETAAKNNIPVSLLTATTQDALDVQVKALLDFKTPQPASKSGVDVGAGSNQPPVFTQAQVSDQKFYHEHRDEILKAMSEGRIR